MKKVYVIGIGGIGISAVARYYNENGYQVYGSDKIDSELIHKLKSEGIDIIIGEDEGRVEVMLENNEKLKTENFNCSEIQTSNNYLLSTNDCLLIYTEAIPPTQKELLKAKEIGIKILSYPESLAEIANSQKLIAITGTHGKSTTTSLTSLVFKNSDLNFSSVVGTLLKEFGQKNFYHRNSVIGDNYFVIEACEYKRSFLRYKPFIAVITNIDLDHLDYYKDLEDYISAFKSFVDNVVPGGYVVLNGDCRNSMSLFGLRKDVNYVIIQNNSFIVIPVKAGIYSKEEYIEKTKDTEILKSSYSKNVSINFNEFIDSLSSKEGQESTFPEIKLQVPGEHIVFDAKLAYVVGKLVGIDADKIVDALESYTGVWRRSEVIGTTINGNILISDYGHHPTEILLTTKAIKEKYQNKKIVCIFQPHQYNRTLELLEDFKNCFKYVDKLIIPDIYESRDSEEDKKKINSSKLVEFINHSDKLDGEGLENTLNMILDYDKKNHDSSIIILQGAGNVDDLRYKIKTV